MARDCTKCGHFGGYDEEGVPYCYFEDGINACPYNDTADTVPKEGFNIQINTQVLEDYIRHTMSNTTCKVVQNIIETKIAAVVRETFTQEIKAQTKAVVEEMVRSDVEKYMEEPITIGGGWGSKARTISRDEYLSECIAKALDEAQKKSTLEDIAKREATSQMNKFSEKLRSDIKRSLKNMLDEATRQTLTASVVDMLMANETYQRLQQSASVLLGDGGAK